MQVFEHLAAEELGHVVEESFFFHIETAAAGRNLWTYAHQFVHAP